MQFLKLFSQKQSAILSCVFYVLIHLLEKKKKKHLASSSQACPELCENLLKNPSVMKLPSLTRVLEKQDSSSLLCIIASNLGPFIFKVSGLEVYANVPELICPLKFLTSIAHTLST